MTASASIEIDGETYTPQQLSNSTDDTKELDSVGEIQFTYNCPFCDQVQTSTFQKVIPGEYTETCSSCTNDIPVTERAFENERVFIFPAEATYIVNHLERIQEIGNVGKQKPKKIYTYVTKLRFVLLTALFSSLTLLLLYSSFLVITNTWTQPYSYGIYLLFSIFISTVLSGGIYETLAQKELSHIEMNLSEILRFKEIFEWNYTHPDSTSKS